MVYVSNKLTDKRLWFLDEASMFFAFIRSWWDGSGLDCVCWWMSQEGPRQKILLTGEVTDFTDPRVVADNAIADYSFQQILDEFNATGIGDIPSQNERLILSHYDCWYGIKESASTEARWVYVAGGRHRNPAGDHALSLIYNKCPCLML